MTMPQRYAPPAEKSTVLSPEKQGAEFFWRLLGPPTQPDGRPLGCVEIRVLDSDVKRNSIVKASQYKKTISGWFDRHDAYRVELGRLRGVSAYVTVNPVRRDLLARINNRLDVADKTTKDEDVVC